MAANNAELCLVGFVITNMYLFRDDDRTIEFNRFVAKFADTLSRKLTNFKHLFDFFFEHLFIELFGSDQMCSTISWYISDR